jgi:GGDEF domain-containing protein
MPEIAGSVALRAVLSAAIIATYTWLAAAEIWRNSESHLVSRIPASFMLFAHGALFQLRTPLAVLMPHPPGTEPIFGRVSLTVLSSEALLFTIAIAFIVIAMAKERTAYVHKTAALIDPLTGIWNRRGFMVESDRLMEASGKKSDHAAMLFIDLDNFKTINDRYGHALGDQVLQILAAAVNTVIRSFDFVGRLGGEEFAVVLHGAHFAHRSSTGGWRVAPQGQRLVFKHRRDSHTRCLLANAVMGEELAGIRNDEIDVLKKLQPLIVIRVAEAHAGANHFQEVENLKRPVALMGAQLAMIHVIDGDQRVDAGIARRLEFLELKLFLVLR